MCSGLQNSGSGDLSFRVQFVLTNCSRRLCYYVYIMLELTRTRLLFVFVIWASKFEIRRSLISLSSLFSHSRKQQHVLVRPGSLSCQEKSYIPFICLWNWRTVKFLNDSISRGCKDSILVHTHKCSLLIMGLHIFEIKLC